MILIYLNTMHLCKQTYHLLRFLQVKKKCSTQKILEKTPDVGKRLSLSHSLGMDCKPETWHSPGLNSWTEAVRVQLQASKHSQQFSLSPQLAGNRNRRGVPHLEPRAGPLIPRMLPRRIWEAPRDVCYSRQPIFFNGEQNLMAFGKWNSVEAW